MTTHIDRLTIERIKERTDIVDIVGRFVQLQKKGSSGARYWGLCPFHDDKHLGSFVVYPKGNVFKCFACGEKGDAVTFLMKHEKLSYPEAIRWLGNHYGIITDDTTMNYTPPPPRQAAPQLPTLTLPRQMVIDRENTERDNLCQWIRTGIKWDEAQRARIETVLTDYHVGHARNGMTIFWYIDQEGNVRTGKMMRYKTDGHRDKGKGWNFDWIHSALARPVIVKGDGGWPLFDDNGQPVTERRNLNIYDEEKQEVRIVPFGLHLLNKYPNATIHMVESEKTALLMAIAYGNNSTSLWMACGGKEMLSRERLAPLINQRRVIKLYPDRDGIDAWKDKARSLGYDLMVVDDKPVTEWWHPDDGDKADIADVVVNAINRK